MTNNKTFGKILVYDFDPNQPKKNLCTSSQVDDFAYKHNDSEDEIPSGLITLY